VEIVTPFRLLGTHHLDGGVRHCCGVGDIVRAYPVKPDAAAPTGNQVRQVEVVIPSKSMPSAVSDFQLERQHRASLGRHALYHQHTSNGLTPPVQVVGASSRNGVTISPCPTRAIRSPSARRDGS